MGTPFFHELEGAMAVAKPELGIKRQCANCGAKFYDLGKSPIICPKCGTLHEIAAAPARRQVAAKPAPVEEQEAAPAEAETVSLEEVAEQEKKKPSPKGAAPNVDVESDDDVEVADGEEDDTFLEAEEEESGDVSDLIGEGIDKKEEET
jgi:uncharacterized protein (TIGR02300 family)